MPKTTHSFYEILNKSPENKTVDLMIYGAIPAWDSDEQKIKNSAESFMREFRLLEKDYDRINIRINSPGGSLYHAFPIFNAILNSKKDVHTYNDGLAASAGGLIFLAGKTKHTAKNGLLMIHNAMAWAAGNSSQIRNVADTLDTHDKVIAKLFAERTGMTEQEVKEKYLNYKDHWLDAEEAKEKGFVDEIDEYESEEMLPSNITEMAFGEVLNFFQEREEQSPSLFDKVLNYVKDALKPSTTSNLQGASIDAVYLDELPTDNQPQNTNMDFKNSLDILNKDQVSAEDLAAVRAEITAFTGAAEKFTAEEVSNKVTAATTEISNELTQVKAEKTDLETKVTDLEATVASYKASGVNPTNTTGEGADPIPGEEVENFLSETDIEAQNYRKAAGLA